MDLGVSSINVVFHLLVCQGTQPLWLKWNKEVKCSFCFTKKVKQIQKNISIKEHLNGIFKKCIYIELRK